MNPLRKILGLSETPALDKLLKLRRQAQAGNDNATGIAQKFEMELESHYQQAAAEYQAGPTPAAYRKLFDAKRDLESSKQMRISLGFGFASQQNADAWKRSRATWALMAAALRERYDLLRAAAEKTQKHIEKSFETLGVGIPDLGEVEPLRTMIARLGTIVDMLALVENAQPELHEVEGILGELETPLEMIELSTAPLVKPSSEGVFTQNNRLRKEEIEANGAVTYSPSMTDARLAVPQDAPRRGNFSPPQLFEDSIEVIDGVPTLKRTPVSFEQAARPASMPGQPAPAAA
jgi:hypothetical protein